MPTEEATRLKNEGTAAYSRNDFLTAVSQFTAAIDKSSATTKEDKDFLKLLHSNRSAAYQNLKQYEKALEDGNRCVAIDAQWPKGYGRKGDALLALKKFGEAYNAYNAGLRITPADQSLAEKAERAMSGIRSETQRAYSGATNDSAASSDSKWTKYLRMAVLGSFFAYCIPFGGMSTLFGRVCAGSFAAEQVLGVLARHGMPRFENDYAVRVLPDPAMPALLLGVFVALSPRVYFMSLLAVLLLSLPLFLPAILQVRADLLPIPQSTHVLTLFCTVVWTFAQSVHRGEGAASGAAIRAQRGAFSAVPARAAQRPTDSPADLGAEEAGRAGAGVAGNLPGGGAAAAHTQHPAAVPLVAVPQDAVHAGARLRRCVCAAEADSRGFQRNRRAAHRPLVPSLGAADGAHGLCDAQVLPGQTGRATRRDRSERYRQQQGWPGRSLVSLHRHVSMSVGHSGFLVNVRSVRSIN